MKFLISAFIALAFSFNAHANENFLKEQTAKALAAGDAAAVVKALEREISHGNVLAAHELGVMHRDGRLVAQDPVKARKYLKIASERNDTRMFFKYGVADSQYALAVLMRDGTGIKADPAGAASWFERAADQGHGPALLALARLYVNGSGVRKDPEQAFIWSSIAAARLTNAEQKEAEQIRDQAQQQLEPTRLAKAKSRVDNWKPRGSLVS